MSVEGVVDVAVVVGNSIDPIDASKEFTVKTLEVPPPPSFPWWIVLAGGVGAVAIYYFWKKT